MVRFSEKTKYTALEAGSEDEASSSHPEDATCDEVRRLRRLNRCYELAVVILLFTSVFQALWLLRRSSIPSFVLDRGLPTDFASARQAIENAPLVQRRFSGHWVWDEEAQSVKRDVDLSEPQFFGNPHEISSIDDNWAKLLEVEFPSLHEDEATPWPDLTPIYPWPLKFIELDVTHSLHCVNHLRTMLYAHYYNHTSDHTHTPSAQESGDFYLTHMDHCLEQLFETVKCSSDLTPAPIYSFFPNSTRATLAVGQTHTCRNFDLVKDWLYDRGTKMPSVNGEAKIWPGWQPPSASPGDP